VPAQHRHAECLEQLRRCADVEQGFRAGRHDERFRPGELAEVGGDVEALAPAAVDPPEPTRAHEANPGGAADGQSCPDSRRTQLAFRRAGGEIARPDFASVRGGRKALELAFLEPDADASVDYSDGGRNRPGDAHAPLGLGGYLAALAARKTVGDERRLERDHRPARLESGAHLRMYAQQLRH
jgi:hypothetical protein